MASSVKGDMFQSDWNRTFSCLTKEASLRLMDMLASHRVEPQQFVDDSIVPTSCVKMLARASSALSKFVDRWRHAYQGGYKGPQILTVGAPRPDPALCGTVGGHSARTVGEVKLLGHWIDEGLVLKHQRTVIQMKLKQAGRQVATTMNDAGFGTPFMGSQYTSRIEGKALAGVEVLASAREGFRAVMERIDAAQVEVARIFLGLPLGSRVGRSVALLAETRLLTRSGTAAAVKVVMARARLACLPLDHPAAVGVAGGVVGVGRRHMDATF
jgi:hypothetical protein